MRLYKWASPVRNACWLPWRIMKAFHDEQLPLDGVMSLIQQGAGHGHLRVCKHRIPPGFLGLQPVAHALTIGCSCGVRHTVGNVTEPLSQRKYAQALALARSVPQGVELCAECRTDRRRDGDQFLRELQERVAQAEAETCSWKQGPQTLGDAVKAIGEDPPDPIGWLLVDCHAFDDRSWIMGEPPTRSGRCCKGQPGGSGPPDGGHELDRPLRRTAAKSQNGGGRSGHHARQGGESNGTRSVWGIDMAKWVFHVVAIDDTRAVVLRKRLARSE